MPISLIVADDHPVVRRGVRALFESEPEFSVLAAAADGAETIRLTESLRPDVLLLDLMMPGLSGLEALRILRDRVPRTKTVILSMYLSSAFVVQALQNGAVGYVLKGSPEELLLQAVREAAAGRRYLSPPVTEIAIRSYVDQTHGATADPHDTLTPRQREVLQLAAEGKTSAEIGAALNISPRTVENHRAMIMQRLGLHNHTELIRHAMRHGLIPPET